MTDKYIVRTDWNGGDLPLTVERSVLAKRPDVRLIGCNCTSDEEVISAANCADVLITNESFVNQVVLSALPHLRAVVRYGIGYDRVDIDTATRLGIVVVNIPGFCIEELAQHVILGILAWNKRFVRMNADVHAGRWLEARSQVNSAMGATSEQTLAVYGFGNAGHEVARLARALGMRVVTCSKHLTDVDRAMGIKVLEKYEMLHVCDFLTVNCALNAQTYHAISAAEFRCMKPDAVVINTARGAVIDEIALIEALRKHRIAAAFLDVLESEPPQSDNPLLGMDNVFITPHVSYYSARSNYILAKSVIEEALRCIDGQYPLNVVNENVMGEQNCRIFHPPFCK